MKYNKGTVGWLRKKLDEKEVNTKDIGFGELIRLGQDNGILLKYNDIHNRMRMNTIKNAKCNTEKEYKDMCAQILGYKDSAEKVKNDRWNKGKHSPFYHAQNLGFYIAERKVAKVVLPVIIGEIIKETPYNYPNFDFICKNGTEDIKIDVKSSMLIDNRWRFHMGHNNVADHFLNLGFNIDGGKLGVSHAWFIRKGEMIKVGNAYGDMMPLWNREKFSVTNTLSRLEYFQRYDCINKVKYYITKVNLEDIDL